MGESPDHEGHVPLPRGWARAAACTNRPVRAETRRGSVQREAGQGCVPAAAGHWRQALVAASATLEPGMLLLIPFSRTLAARLQVVRVRCRLHRRRPVWRWLGVCLHPVPALLLLSGERAAGVFPSRAAHASVLRCGREASAHTRQLTGRRDDFLLAVLLALGVCAAAAVESCMGQAVPLALTACAQGARAPCCTLCATRRGLCAGIGLVGRFWRRHTCASSS